jgi:hypothetical protein
MATQQFDLHAYQNASGTFTEISVYEQPFEYGKLSVLSTGYFEAETLAVVQHIINQDMAFDADNHFTIAITAAQLLQLKSLFY